ncbi:hypothetical protein V4C53_44245 [Paraburkholderia azotifigens]|uniref:hypothetical protein n=1 Tax=Paraburkholderia azotifigens TaxID=2057004 RepID=UPI00316EA6FF
METLTGQRVSPEQPGYLQWPDPVGADLVDDLLTALARIDAPLLAGQLVEHVLAKPAPFDMDAIVVPAVLALTARAQTAMAPSVQRLRAACLAHLRSRIAQPLAPPADFARENTIGCRCVHCAELGRFLVDPARREWTLKAAEGSRSHVERSIRQYGCDVDCTTNRFGRPYSLVCRKNEASYKRRERQRKDDLHHLERLETIAGRG